jgi:hypothetical protein
MSVPSTRGPQKLPFSQITRGLDALRFSCSCRATMLQGNKKLFS